MPQGFAAFDMLGVYWNAGHGADLHALGLVKMAHAFGAFVGVDLVDFLSQGDGLVRALGLTHIAVDALVSDSQCHAVLPVDGESARRDCSEFRETVFMRRIIPRPCPALL